MKYSQEEFVGKTFGRWTVISFSHRTPKQDYWTCRCSCGKEKVVLGKSLRKEESRSCGCLRDELSIERYTKNLTGMRFGKLTVVSISDKKSRGKVGNRYWNCMCECGKQTISRGDSLLNGESASCGCVSIAKLVEMAKKQIGPLSTAYNPNLSDENRSPRNVKEVAHWRKAVFAMDDYRCVLTCKRGGRLHAHHIESWNSNKEKRFDVGNGVTLSAFAHKLFHAIFGRGNNTREQYNTFARNMQTAEAAT